MKKQPIRVKYKYQAEEWLNKILKKNELINSYNQEILKQFLKGFLHLSLNAYQLRAGIPVNQ